MKHLDWDSIYRRILGKYYLKILYSSRLAHLRSIYWRPIDIHHSKINNRLHFNQMFYNSDQLESNCLHWYRSHPHISSNSCINHSPSNSYLWACLAIPSHNCYFSNNTKECTFGRCLSMNNSHSKGYLRCSCDQQSK